MAKRRAGGESIVSVSNVISSCVDFEAGDERILDILLGRGKEFTRMDLELWVRWGRVLDLIEEVQNADDLRLFRSLDLKFFDGHFQIRVNGEKRLWFEVNGDTMLITYFGSTDHRHGRKR